MIPDTAKDRPQEGEVVAVGRASAKTASECRWRSRSAIASFCQCGGTEIKIDGENTCAAERYLGNQVAKALKTAQPYNTYIIIHTSGRDCAPFLALRFQVSL